MRSFTLVIVKVTEIVTISLHPENRCGVVVQVIVFPE